MKKTLKTFVLMLITILMLMSTMPVTASAASNVKLNKTKITLNVKKTYQLKISGTKKKVKWSSSNKKVATVSSKGKITAKKKGTAKINAKVGGKKYTCNVTVKQPVTSVKLNKKAVTLTKKGQTAELKATVKPTSANNRKVSWKSSNPKVATVDAKGVVKALSNGTAKITVVAKDRSKKKATCTITVKIKGKPSAGNTTEPETHKHQWVPQTAQAWVENRRGAMGSVWVKELNQIEGCDVLEKDRAALASFWLWKSMEHPTGDRCAIYKRYADESTPGTYIPKMRPGFQCVKCRKDGKSELEYNLLSEEAYHDHVKKMGKAHEKYNPLDIAYVTVIYCVKCSICGNVSYIID